MKLIFHMQILLSSTRESVIPHEKWKQPTEHAGTLAWFQYDKQWAARKRGWLWTWTRSGSLPQPFGRQRYYQVCPPAGVEACLPPDISGCHLWIWPSGFPENTVTQHHCHHPSSSVSSLKVVTFNYCLQLSTRLNKGVKLQTSIFLYSILK
jgi:hypothetical protein